MKSPYEPILKELASRMLETTEIKKNFSNDAFLDACLIFQTVLFNKIYDLQTEEKMLLEDKLKMAESCGTELKKLIHTYTGLDTFELVNNYGK